MQSSLDTPKIANPINFKYKNYIASTIEQVNIAPKLKARRAVIKMTVVKPDEDGYKIEKHESFHVKADHFVSGTPQTRSQMKRSVDGSFGELMTYMSEDIKNLKKQRMAIPAFTAIFATLILGIPTPAFALTETETAVAIGPGAAIIATMQTLPALLPSAVAASAALTAILKQLH
jgi:hypothetical protein